MKYTLKRQLFCAYDELNDQEQFAQVHVLRNTSANADKTILVVVHRGIYQYEMHEDPIHLHCGGELKVYPNQTEKQLNNRLKTFIRGFDQRSSYTHVFELDELKDHLLGRFGAARAKPMIKAAEFNLHYMQREDGSAVLEGEDFRSEEVVPARSVEAEPKPIGWGAW